MDKTEVGHPLFGGKLLVGHGPLGWRQRSTARSLNSRGGVCRFGVTRCPAGYGQLVPKWAELLEDLTGDVALEHAGDLTGGLAFGATAGDVVPGRLVRAHASDHHAVERVVGLAIAAAVEPVAAGLADDASSGATPHMWANAASLVNRSGLSPAAISKLAATS